MYSINLEQPVSEIFSKHLNNTPNVLPLYDDSHLQYFIYFVHIIMAYIYHLDCQLRNTNHRIILQYNGLEYTFIINVKCIEINYSICNS